MMINCPYDLQELYFEFGRAAEMAQLMETEAGNLALVYATMFVDLSQISDEQRSVFLALVEDVNKRTFGNLIKQIQKVAKIDIDTTSMMDDALEKRNYLTHKFFRKYNFAIFSEEGRKTMIEDVREIHRCLNMAHITLSSMTTSLEQLLEDLYGRKTLSEQEALALMTKGKRVNGL